MIALKMLTIEYKDGTVDLYEVSADVNIPTMSNGFFCFVTSIGNVISINAETVAKIKCESKL
jgi:hypothetical protein